MFYRVFRLEDGAPKSASGRLHLPKAVEELDDRMEAHGENLDWRFMRRGSIAGWSEFRSRAQTRELVRERLEARQDNEEPDAYVVENEAGFRLLVRELLVFEHAHAPLPAAASSWSPKIRHVYKTVFGSQWEHGEVESYGTGSCRRMNLEGNPPNPPWSMHANWPPVLAIDIGTLEADDPHVFADEMVARLVQEIDGLVFVTWRDNSLHEDHNHVQDGPNRSGTPACAL